MHGNKCHNSASNSTLYHFPRQCYTPLISKDSTSEYYLYSVRSSCFRYMFSNGLHCSAMRCKSASARSSSTFFYLLVFWFVLCVFTACSLTATPRVTIVPRYQPSSSCSVEPNKLHISCFMDALEMLLQNEGLILRSMLLAHYRPEKSQPNG